ncbi:hypothetical protein M5689_004285 [Euphorbia peplus]|nr:hypothetical protein M5689_004285 [Euphorbia peplus]
METSESIESLNEWEHVQSETHPPVFPPSSHEGLQIPPPPPPPPSSSESQTSTQPSSPVGPSDSSPRLGNEIVKRLRLRLERFRCGIVWIANRGIGRGALLSVASVSLVVAATVLMYARLQRWRQRVREHSESRLILVIKEKDQKINQLFHHIAQMNEMLSARRKVAVVRVG